MQVAAIQAGFSALLGDESSEAAEAGRAALRHIEETGAELYRKLWADGLPREVDEAQGAAG